MRFGILLALVAAAVAQTPDTAAIRGHIADQTGAGVADAAISITNTATGLRRTAVSGAAGHYSVPSLPLTGSYDVVVFRSGFAPATALGIKLRAGETVAIDFNLVPGASYGSVTVFGTAAGVENGSPQIGDRIENSRIENTPLLGRKLTSLPLLDSSVRPARGAGDLFLGNTLFVVSGSGRRQTSYTIDGGTADDAWGRQTIFTNLPLVALEEVTVLTNAFSAEYGRTTGPVINVNTRSGTDAFHGEAIIVGRPSGTPPDRLQQYSGTISGPLIETRTHFLVAGEYNRQDRDSLLTSPLASGMYTGHLRQNLAMGRIDHRLTNTNSIGLRLALDRLSDTNPNDSVGALSLPSTARVFRRVTYTAQLMDTAILSPAFVNESRSVFMIGSPITQFTPVTPSTQFFRPGIATEGDSRIANLQNHQWQWSDALSVVHGTHLLKLGADALRSVSGGVGQEFGSGFLLGQFTLRPGITKPIAELTLADVQSFQQSFGNASYKVAEWLGSAFIQDNWRLRPSLTLNLGMRYESQTFTDDRLDFQPRVGFAFSPGASQRTVIRGSYGLYYSQVRANLAAGFRENGPEGVFNFGAAPGQFGFPASFGPLPAFPPGAVLPPRDITVRPGERAYSSRFFDVSKLTRYPDRLLNPRTQLAAFGFGRQLAAKWVLAVDYTHQFTTRIDRPLDLNAPSLFIRTAPDQVRSRAQADTTRPIVPVPNGYRRIVSTVNDGISRYDGLTTNFSRRYNRTFSVSLSYTYSHAINTVEPDVPNQDPNDANLLGRTERATSLLDQRHRAVISGWWNFSNHWSAGTLTSIASGRPYNITTGVDNNGDGSNVDRPVINGAVIGRNAGRGTPVYDAGAFVQFGSPLIRENVKLVLRAEGFNVLNHANIVGRNGAYGQPAFGTPLAGISNVDPGRQLQFMLRVQF